jgi:hypothetical protein
VKYVPGVLGAVLLVAAAAVVFWPAGLAVAGVLLLVVDRRIG